MSNAPKPNSTTYRKLALTLVGAVLNERGAQYENGEEDNFAAIAKALSAVLRKKLKCDLTGRDVAKISLAIKLVRDNIEGFDNAFDSGGYGVLFAAWALSELSEDELDILCAKYGVNLNAIRLDVLRGKPAPA